MLRNEPGKRRVSRGLWLASLIGVCVSARAHAEDTRPPEPEELRQACLAAHETAQLARLDGKLVLAKQRLGACAVANCPAALRADCTQWLAEVKNAIPSVVLAATSERGDETQVRVFLDGSPLTDRLDGNSFELDPGPHRFRFELAPYAAIEESLLLREGERERLVRVRFVNAAALVTPPGPARAPAPAARARPVPWITYALGGLSLVALGTTTYFGLHALGEQNDKLDTCAPLCSSAEIREVSRPALAADISLLVAVLAGGGAAYTYWTRPALPANTAFLSYGGEF